MGLECEKISDEAESPPPPPKKWLGYDRKTITIRYEFLLRMEDFHVFFISLVNSVQMFLLIVWCIHLTSD